MAFMIFCLDKANHLETRLANRPAHVEHLTKHESHLISAGPLLTYDGEAMIGSLLVVDFAAVPFIDSTAANTIESLAHKARRHGVEVYLTGTNHDVRRELAAHHIKSPLVHYAATVDDAIMRVRPAATPEP